jgi:6-phosphogluconolactonase (cycloisomerase 2 family)
MARFTRPLIFSIAILGISVFSSAQLTNASASARSAKGSGAVFVMSNDAAKNQVIAYDRAADGSLGEATPYDTNGRGSGGTTDPLESQGSLTLSQDHSLLFAVNAGSGDVSVFSVHRSNLNLLNRTPSGGAQPSAIAEHNGLVYVLNSGGAGSLVGFQLNFGGQLKQIKNSTAFLTATTTGGASLAFSPNGQFLVVTERVANNVDVFHVEPNGTLSPIVVNANPAPGTFSVSFAPNGEAIVSETGPASEPTGSATSSYTVNANGTLTAISQSVPTLGAGNCWNAITPDGTKVYTSNSGSDNISGFNIGKNGTLTPISGTIVGENPTGSHNVDIAVTADGKFLYTINSQSGNVGMFAINQDGSLTNLGQAGDLPKSVGFNGIAAL